MEFIIYDCVRAHLALRELLQSRRRSGIRGMSRKWSLIFFFRRDVRRAHTPFQQKKKCETSSGHIVIAQR